MTERLRSAEPEEIREQVRSGYERIANEGGEGLAGNRDHARRIGYDESQIAAVPDGANLGLGCGNPTGLATLRPGDRVLDLGSGAGFDALLAAREVGPGGRVIGVDMGDAMLERARANARNAGLENVEFRKGQIEALPVDDDSIDAVISNCVINLSPEKNRVFAEAYRVLRPGGRLMVSDIVLERSLPDELMESVDATLGCVGGASLRSRYLAGLADAGFEDVKVVRETSFSSAFPTDDPRVREAAARHGLDDDEMAGLLDAVTSVHVMACKPIRPQAAG